MQYAKVADFQRRGLVHFHALIRLDGPKTADGFAPAPTGIDATVPAQLVGQAAAAVRLPVPGVDPERARVVLAFGRQLDARPVRASRRPDDPDGPLTPEQVAGYLAKYATKSATDSGAADTPHHRQIRASCREFAARTRAAWGPDEQDNPYSRLEHWVHMLGFRGHFASKSRATRSPSCRPRRSGQCGLCRYPESACGRCGSNRSRQAEERLAAGAEWIDSGLGFTTRQGTPSSRTTCVAARTRLRTAIGEPELRFHDLRHTCVTLLLELGVPPHIVREIVGHSDLSVTMTIYAHASLEGKRRALSQLDERLA